MTGKVKVSQNIINKLIDDKGRRKYFKKLDPKLQDAPFEIDIKLIKKKFTVFQFWI